MILLRRFTFFISLLCALTMHAQEQVTDSIVKTEVYGLRLGVDISKPIISFIEEDFSGFEVVADYRIKGQLYAALEFGSTHKTTNEDYMNFTTDGSYVKIGINYNVYQNWVGMNNQIFFGARYGLSFFNQTLNYYTPNVYGLYFDGETQTPGTEYTDLNASWLEIVTGLKVETLKNLFLGFNFSVNFLSKTEDPENFKNLFIPGFNRVYLNDMGWGFTFTVSYLIPFSKKSS